MTRFPPFSSSASVRPILFFTFTALLIGLAGCAAVKPPTAPKPPVPQWEASKLIEALKQRNEKFRSLRSLAQVDYAGPEGKHGFQEAVNVQRPDRLRLETLSLLGTVLIVTANDKEIIGHHTREGIFVRGRPTEENLRRYTQIPLELPAVTMLLMGLPPVDPSTPWTQEGNTLFFSSHNGKRDALTFESAEPVPTKWERFNGENKVELSAEFGDYISASPGPFPQTIVMEAPLQKKKLSIRYKEPEFNGPIPAENFTQQKPPHAQEVPIEAVGS